ncbi:MAG TPA: PKD domain-containing protein [Cyclobacteriaceae bacterium]|nr:PKD domain-containing protein [Cyclobacteriaceae bacterium]
MVAARKVPWVGFLLLCSGPTVALANPDPALHFIENRNQWPIGIDFSARIPGGRLFIQPGMWRFSFLDEQKLQARHEQGHSAFNESGAPHPSDECVDAQVIQLSFVGSNPHALAHPFGVIPTTFNYFIGNDPEKWGTRAKGYDGVLYTGLYNDIDLKVTSEGNNLKYDFILAPGADPQQIVIEYQGSDPLWIENGNVMVHSALASLTEGKPIAYQEIEGRRKRVRCEYALESGRISYRFPDGYDPCYSLIIDPLLIFSTYSGSTADSWGSSATPGEHGKLYSSGVTSQYIGGTFPTTPGAFQTTYGGNFDVGILKYDSTGENVLYASYLGGNAFDSPHSLVMNAQQELIVLGTTSSLNFPTTSGVIDRSFNGGTFEDNVYSYDNGSDIFVARISADGSQLMGSTFIGGSANDGLNPSGGLLVKNYGDQLRGDVITDEQGNIFISTVTSSSDFPVVNSFNTLYQGGATDAVVMELNNTLTQIVWGAMLGGSSSDASHTITLDNAGNIFVAGGTGSLNFPATAGSYQPLNAGDADGWIAHLAGDGSAILSATFTGTPGFNQIYFLDLNQQEEVYVYGQTVGSFPVTSGVYSNPNSGQFIQKFDNGLSTLLFSTVFGTGRGKPDISPTAFLVNDCNNLYMTGWGGRINSDLGYWNSDTFGMPVTANAYQSTTHGSDFYFMVLTDDAKQLLYGTYMGGADSRTHVDGGTSRFDKKGVVYHAVCSGCQALNATHAPTSDFPTTPHAHSNTNRSPNCNNAAFKFDLSSLHAIIQTNTVKLNVPGYNGVCIPDKIVFQNLSTGGEFFEWNLGDGTALLKTDTAFVIHEYKKPGKYTVKLKAIDASTCVGKDSTFTTIDVWMPEGTVTKSEVICLGASAQLTASGGVTYDWISDDGKFTSQQAQFSVAPEDTIRYFVTITDIRGCVANDTVKISVVPGVDLKFDARKVYDCFSRPSVQVTNRTDPKEEVFFDFGDGTTTDQDQDTHQFQKDGTYPVRLVGRKEFCVYDTTIDLPVYELKVPNVITPGTPDLNDTFVIQYAGRPISESTLRASLSIFNRWGKKVYQTDDYRDDWSAENVDAGVYYYKAEIVGETTCKGWVQVVK